MAYVSPSSKPTGTLITAATWNQDIVANEQASAPDVFAAKGDLFVGTAEDTGAKLTVGTNGDVLMVDSGETTGLKWAKQISLAARVGGDDTAWATPGSTAYTPGRVIMQAGSVTISIGNGTSTGTVSVTLPIPVATPLIIATISTGYEIGPVILRVDSGSVGEDLALFFYADRAGTSGTLTFAIHWLAIGPE
jgi:hypothetical protein